MGGSIVPVSRLRLLGYSVSLVLLLSIVLPDVAHTPVSASAPSLHHPFFGRSALSPAPPDDIQLDNRLPVQTLEGQNHFLNLNAKFGSRLDFAIAPGSSQVRSGTDGVFHDTPASYVVGVTPANQKATYMFHMGTPNSALGDTYVHNERWMQGVNTSRWLATVPTGSPAMGSDALHVVLDVIDTFAGEPGCTTINACRAGVRDDTVPVFIVGVTLQNFSTQEQAGTFIFGSNRALPPINACVDHVTPEGTPVHTLSYASRADATGGTLFLAGDQDHWDCNTSMVDRAGLSWRFSIGALQTDTAYLILGGWNANPLLFNNTLLPAGCQSEGLYATSEWSSEDRVVDFAIDNLFTHDDLLGRAQTMEDLLISNDVLTPQQRWLIGDALRSYKAMSWLTARQRCAGGGYDAAVYEGNYGFLSTVDVMHEYGYFEINRVPWFFRAAMSVVLQNASSDTFGTYFQHDQGGDVDGNGNCTDPGKGIPTIRASCYAPPYASTGMPMPTEENDNVVLLMAYYEHVTADRAFLRLYIRQLEAAMLHNVMVGDPSSGIAYRLRDTNTTYDAADDCLHNTLDGAGNLYYQGLKEAAGYHAMTYLDGLARYNASRFVWQRAAAQIEDTLVSAYSQNGFLPISMNSALSNCGGRTIATGEGLFYLHLSRLDAMMNQELLTDLARQYPADLAAVTLTQPAMIVMASPRGSGSSCGPRRCLRYTWFSKVILSSLVADLVYTHYGCSSCARLDTVQAAYNYNLNVSTGYSDGFHDDGTDWLGHFYPRGIISWAFLDAAY